MDITTESSRPSHRRVLGSFCHDNIPAG